MVRTGRQHDLAFDRFTLMPWFRSHPQVVTFVRDTKLLQCGPFDFYRLVAKRRRARLSESPRLGLVRRETSKDFPSRIRAREHPRHLKICLYEDAHTSSLSNIYVTPDLYVDIVVYVSLIPRISFRSIFGGAARDLRCGPRALANATVCGVRKAEARAAPAPLRHSPRREVCARPVDATPPSRRAK